MLNALRARVEDSRAHAARPGSPTALAAGPALFLLRPEFHERRFLKSRADELHGAVLAGHQVAPYPEGSTEAGEGLRGDELAQLMRELRIDFVVDPETASLPVYDRDNEEDKKRFGRAQYMRSARHVPFRAEPERFDDDTTLRNLVMDTISGQVGAAFRTAPYFRFSSLDDPWLAVNLRAAKMTQGLDRGRAIGIFVQVEPAALRAGVMAEAAAEYAKALDGRGIVFLQAPGIQVEKASATSLAAYLAAVTAWRVQGFTVIADRVNRFGVAAVGAGATGMTSGLRAYRNQPDDFEEYQRWRGPKIQYWAPERGDWLAIAKAAKRRGRWALPPCPVDGCQALARPSDKNLLRWHNAHLMMAELEEVLEAPGDFAAAWQDSPRRFVRDWGKALAEAVQKREQL